DRCSDRFSVRPRELPILRLRLLRDLARYEVAEAASGRSRRRRADGLRAASAYARCVVVGKRSVRSYPLTAIDTDGLRPRSERMNGRTIGRTGCRLADSALGHRGLLDDRT